MSQSGSMANLMNLVRSKSRSRASHDGGGSVLLSMGMEGLTVGGWFGKARSNFMRPWHGGDGGSPEGEDASASEEGKKAFGETKQARLFDLIRKRTSTDFRT